MIIICLKFHNLKYLAKMRSKTAVLLLCLMFTDLISALSVVCYHGARLKED